MPKRNADDVSLRASRVDSFELDPPEMPTHMGRFYGQVIESALLCPCSFNLPLGRDGHGYGFANFGYEHADPPRPGPYPDKHEPGTRRPAGPTGLRQSEPSSLDFRSFPMSQSTFYSLNCLCGGRGRFAFDSTAVAVPGIEVEAHAPSDKSVCRSLKSRFFPPISTAFCSSERLPLHLCGLRRPPSFESAAVTVPILCTQSD
jgi:hypothetical protein